MLSVSDAAATKAAMTSILRSVIATEQSAAGVAVSTAYMSGGDNMFYATSYRAGDWYGDLKAVSLRPTDPPSVGDQVWSARQQMDRRATSRYIVTATGGGEERPGIQFQPTAARTATKLTQAQETALGGASILAYLRGDRSHEGVATAPSYRTRTSVLGDMVNAEPVVLTKPSATYADVGYAAFRTTRANRPKTVFQGANDGMLHAFDGQTGAELWAYIPTFLLPKLKDLSRKDDFTHKYYVDGTPSVADVDFGRTGATVTTDDWHTVLVGGLGKGGNGYYGLDVTNPVADSEANAAAKVMWEFPSAANKDTQIVSGSATSYGQAVGYSFGKPLIVKTAKSGWVVLVTSGYDNGADTGGNGNGYLFVLNAKTGAVIKAISTGTGTSANPSGLAQISAYVENALLDRTADYVYGGDLFGNVWRFDLSGTVDKWSVTRLATLVDKDGNVQPVTTAPELGKISTNGALRRMVYVGTGQFLSDHDVPGSTTATAGATRTQTMYGLVDDRSSTPLVNPLRSSLQQQVLSQANPSATTRTLTNHAVDYTAKKGWYVDMPITGERVNTNPVLASGMLIFSTNILKMKSCETSAQSWLNVVDYQTGGAVSDSGAPASQLVGHVMSSRPVILRPEGSASNGGTTSSRNRLTSVVGTSDVKQHLTSLTRPAPPKVVRRISWRELHDH